MRENVGYKFNSLKLLSLTELPKIIKS